MLAGLFEGYIFFFQLTFTEKMKALPGSLPFSSLQEIDLTKHHLSDLV